MEKKKSQMVRVHTCFAIEEGERFPSMCACRRVIHRHQARRWVSVGLCDWVIDADGITRHDKVCIIGGSAVRTPRCATIEEPHILRAYVNGDLEEVARIEEYGRSTKDAWSDLIKFEDPEKFDRDKASDYGIPVIWSSFDDRTVGGIGKYSWDREKK